MMEVEPVDNIQQISSAKSQNNESLNISLTNNLSSYNKIIKELNYDIFPKYETFNFQKENYISSESDINENIGIIIDNGSYECRAGWSICTEPNICCRNLLAKPKLNDDNFSHFIVGNSIFEYEQGKINKKSPFEKNIIAHFSTQEHIFDHIFSNLNISDNNINHPVLITEPVCNLSFSRKCMTELMFELYGVPSLTYGIDMMFSYYYNNYEKIKNNFGLGNCLIISSSNQVTHILPIIDNKLDIKNTRRISIGSENAKDLLMKSLQLKYSDIKQKLTNEVIQDIYHKYTMAAIDYEQQLKLIEILHRDEQEKYHKLDLVNIYGTLDMYQKVIDSYKEDKNYDTTKNNISQKQKFSYLKSYTNLVNYIDEKEKNVEKNIINNLYFFKKPFMGVLPFITQEELKAKQEAKNEQIRRLREIMKKKREENYRNMRIELEQLNNMIALKDQDKFKFEEMLTNTGYESVEEILQRINKLNAKLNNDINNLENTHPEDIESRWYLLSMPDEDLTEEQIKMKRIQKMQKNAYYSRLEKKEIARREKEKIETLKKENKEKYLVSLYRTKKEILERLNKYEELKRDMVNRHSKTNMKRMQTLAELGKNSDGMEKGSHWDDDDFGKNDEDWEIYREVNKNNINEEEEEDMNRLHDIENQISEIDKNYYGNVQQYQYNFYQENDYFILGVDQFRCAELLFKPYIIGVEQAGIIEIISQIFKGMNLTTKKNLAKNIFITGGNTYYPFLKERVYHDLRSYLPVDVDINVMRAENPILDAWKGARYFFNDTYSIKESNNINLREKIYMNKKEYEEYGVEYFKEHFCGNTKINN